MIDTVRRSIRSSRSAHSSYAPAVRWFHSIEPEPGNTEVRAGVGEAAVWGGIPSVALLPDSMSDDAFERYLDELFAELGTGERLILGVADNVPPDADLGRMERIEERIEAFGAVEVGSE